MEGGKAGEQLRPREIIESVGERGKVWRRQGRKRRWIQRRVLDKVHLTLFPHPPFATVPHFFSMQLSSHAPHLLSRPAFCSCWSGFSQVLFLMPCNQALFSASFSASRGRERESLKTCQIE